MRGEITCSTSEVLKDLKQFLKVAASGGFQGSETVSEGCCFLLGIFRLGLLEVFMDLKHFLKVAASGGLQGSETVSEGCCFLRSSRI